MRARLFLTLSTLAFFGAGCTAFIASQLSGESSDGGNTQIGAGCFHVTSGTCGQCIVDSCENPNGSPPVSLAKVCSLEQYSPLALAVEECTANPGLDNYECTAMYIDGGSYAATIDDPGAAESNLQHCITDNCVTSCSQCNVDVPTCASETVSLVEAGACGQCFDQAMNQPGGYCQAYALANDQYGEAVCSEAKTAIGKCAIPAGQCQTADCTDLGTPPTQDDPALQNLYACLWQQCQSSCQ